MELKSEYLTAIRKADKGEFALKLKPYPYYRILHFLDQRQPIP